MTDVRADLTASVWKVVVEVGQVVAAGDAIAVLESMKMEIPVEAPRPGTVTDLLVAAGDPVTEGQVIAVID